jgi:DNA-binding transcriptional LysR family regulator
MRLDPTSLKLFVSIVEEGTIARAGEREHLSAAAVSKRISELESALRTQLLNRTNKGVEPTAAGVALLNLARQLLNDLDDIYVQMRDYASGTRGQVRVFANISAITQFLPRELASFLHRYPDVQVHLEERISTAIVKAVVENVADIGIFTMFDHGQRIEVLPYHGDELMVIAPNDHPLAGRGRVSFADTLDHEYVGLHPGSAINLLLTKAATDLHRTFRMRMQVTGYDALCLMVEAGLGIGVLPRTVAEPYLRSLRVTAITLDEPWSRRELKICVRAYDELPVAARLLVDHLKQPTPKEALA